MHCPSCGTDTTLDQRFCRSCGMGLETVSKLVAEHSSAETLKLEKALTVRALQKRLYHTLMWGMVSLMLGLAVLVTGKNFALPKSIMAIGTVFLFLAMGLMAYGALSTLRDGTSIPGKFPPSGRTGELPETEASKELPPARAPIPVATITERTTQLIATEDVGKPRE